jgi:acetolactate synthase-1/3 small subunit
MNENGTTTTVAGAIAENTIIASNVPPQAEGLIVKNGVPTIAASGEAGVNTMSGTEKLHTISILVENKAGVLARVSHVFARRGYNIESLAVSRTEDHTVSRMTVVIAGNDEVFDQMGKQLFKLIDVIKVIDHTRDNLVERELALIKVRATTETRAEIMQIAEVFRASLVDISLDTVMIEVTGKEEKVDAIQGMLEKFEILELVRTGRTVLVRGPKQT